MIKRIAALAAVVMACMMMLAGCREASRANWKNGWKADSFDCQRRIVVYNARTDSVVMVAEGCFSLSNNEDAGQLKGSYYVQEMDEVPERYRLCDTDEREVEMEPYNLRINGYEVYKGIYGPVLIAPELLGPVEQVSGLYQRHTDDGGTCYVVVKSGVFVAALIDVTDELTPEMLERLGQAYNDGAVACDEERERQKEGKTDDGGDE